MPGIAESGKPKGDPARQLVSDQLVDYIVQHHKNTSRPGRSHFDLRLGTPDTGLFSWAIPKERLPEKGEKLLAPQTPIHPHGYGEYTGPVGKGYNAGIVERVAKGKARVERTTPNAVHFQLDSGDDNPRYSLIRLKDSTKWLLLNRGPAGAHYQMIDAPTAEDAVAEAQVAGTKSAAITLDIEEGDTLLFGRYKNSPHVVEEIGTDDKGQPTVNGMKLLACRIKKKMPGEKKAELTPGTARLLADSLLAKAAEAEDKPEESKAKRVLRTLARVAAVTAIPLAAYVGYTLKKKKHGDAMQRFLKTYDKAPKATADQAFDYARRKFPQHSPKQLMYPAPEAKGVEKVVFDIPTGRWNEFHITEKQSPIDLIKHELGHVTDVDNKGPEIFANLNFLGKLKRAPFMPDKYMPRWAAEDRAWNYAGTGPNNPLRQAALDTYASDNIMPRTIGRYGIPAAVLAAVASGDIPLRREDDEKEAGDATPAIETKYLGGDRMNPESLKRHPLMAVPKAAQAQAQHTLISGHSGAGKSTYAKRLAEATGKPLIQLDNDPEFRKMHAKSDQYVAADPANHPKFREMALRALAAKDPSIIEGFQLAYTQPEDLEGHERVVIDPGLLTVVRRRLKRDRARARLKGTSHGGFSPEELVPGRPGARRRAATAKALVALVGPGLERFSDGAEKAAQVTNAPAVPQAPAPTPAPAPKTYNAAQLYDAISAAETGVYKQPWKRSVIKPRVGKSYAYGPAQVKPSTLRDYADRFPQMFPEDQQLFINRMEAQDHHFNKWEGKPEAPPEFQAGGRGNLIKTDKDKLMYQAVAARLIQKQYEEKQKNLEAFIKRWRGRSRGQDDPYYNVVEGNLGVQ